MVFNGDRQVALAAMSVFFTTLIGILLGLRAADPTSLDLVPPTAAGVAAAAPGAAGAACPALSPPSVAAPSAMLGAIIGEYLGGSTAASAWP